MTPTYFDPYGIIIREYTHQATEDGQHGTTTNIHTGQLRDNELHIAVSIISILQLIAYI
jgi:hypothetical protein